MWHRASSPEPPRLSSVQSIGALRQIRMPRAVKGARGHARSTILRTRSCLLTHFETGVLIECDPSVKAIILKYDEEKHDYIVEDLDDDRHLVIKESQLQNLKARLSQVCYVHG